MVRIIDYFKKIFDHSGFRQYFTNTWWLLLERLLRIIAALSVGVYIARYMGPDEYGTYSYLFAFVSLFSIISTLGLDNIIVRELVKYPEKRNIYLGTGFWLKVGGALLAFFILFVVLQFTSNSFTINLYILIIASSLIFQSFEVINYYFQSIVFLKYVSICRIIQIVLSSLMKLFFIFMKADLFWFVLLSLIDSIFFSIAHTIIYWKQKVGFFFKYFKLHTAKEMLRYAWPMILTSVSVLIYMKIDQVMIKEMLDETELGLYSAAVILSEGWYFIPSILTVSLFPAILNAKKKSQELYNRRLQRFYDLIIWLMVIISVPITLLADWIVMLLYGQSFGGTAAVLKIHIWASVFVGLGSASSCWLIAENLQIKGTINSIIGAIINIILNFILIPKYGIKGAAIATVISYGCSGYFFLFFSVKTRKNFYMLSKTFNPMRLFLFIKKRNIR